jgi:hypothetical protein
MTKVPPEQLMAYVDGELDAAEHAAVAHAVAADPELQKLVRVFQATGEPLRPLYDDIAQEPVPDWLLKTVDRQVDALRSEPMAAGSPARHGLLAAMVPWNWRAAGVIAALVVAAGAGFLLRDLASDRPAEGGLAELFAIDGATVLARGPLAAALDSGPSGTAVPLGRSAADGALTPTFSFVTTSAQVCRQYVLAVPSGGFDGIACRSPGGDGWRIAVHAPTQLSAASNGDANRVASGPGDATPVDSFVSAVIEGDVLGGDVEATLIANGWRGDNR